MTQTSKLQIKKSIELADILREHIVDYQEKHPLHHDKYKIVFDLLNCRTAYLGGHINRCIECGEERISYTTHAVIVIAQSARICPVRNGWKTAGRIFFR